MINSDAFVSTQGEYLFSELVYDLVFFREKVQRDFTVGQSVPHVLCADTIYMNVRLALSEAS